jgi:hypothetical protein
MLNVSFVLASQAPKSQVPLTDILIIKLTFLLTTLCGGLLIIYFYIKMYKNCTLIGKYNKSARLSKKTYDKLHI